MIKDFLRENIIIILFEKFANHSNESLSVDTREYLLFLLFKQKYNDEMRFSSKGVF